MNMRGGMKLYSIVGNNTCIRCKMIKSHFDSLGINYNYIDTDSDYGKDLIKINNIDELPFIFDNKGSYTIQEIMNGHKAK